MTSVHLWTSLIISAAALLQSLTGFGFNLVASPLLTLILEPRQSVPALILLWIPLGLWLMRQERREINWQRVGLLLCGGLIGLPLGAHVVAVADKAVIRIVIGLVSVLAALALWKKAGRQIRAERAACVAIGVLSGALCGVSAMSGPPVVLFGLNQRWESKGLRADLLAYFTLLSIGALGVFARERVLTSACGWLVMQMTPAAVAGLAVGVLLARRLQPNKYRSLALMVILVSGLLPLAQQFCEATLSLTGR